MHDSTRGPSPGRAKGVPSAASSYLKLRPVHGHARPVVGSEPPQVLHRVGSFEALLQFTVNVFVAKSERSVTLGRQGQPHSSQPSACHNGHRGLQPPQLTSHWDQDSLPWLGWVVIWPQHAQMTTTNNGMEAKALASNKPAFNHHRATWLCSVPGNTEHIGIWAHRPPIRVVPLNQLQNPVSEKFLLIPSEVGTPPAGQLTAARFPKKLTTANRSMCHYRSYLSLLTFMAGSHLPSLDLSFLLRGVGTIPSIMG